MTLASTASKNYKILENEKVKLFRSKEFNYNFNKITGYHEQWGATKEEDSRSPYGPVIADIEVVSMCKGPGGKLCPFCYKSNTPKGEYMTLEQFKTVFHKLPRTLTQIAFGADADCSLNPDIFDMMKYCRENTYNQVIPNITVADITEETAKKLASLCGAVAVSWYGVHTSKDYCYDSIDRLTNAGLKQINIHFMLSKETISYVDELIQDIKTDPRLRQLNAVVFLSLKQKGRGEKFNGCSVEEFKTVVDKMLENGIGFGFDSCSAPKFLESVKDRAEYSKFKDMAEPCESFSQSTYINEKGILVPCSFMERVRWNTLDYDRSNGWDLLDSSIKDADEFVDKVWNSKEGVAFSNNARKCVECGRGCQVYNV